MGKKKEKVYADDNVIANSFKNFQGTQGRRKPLNAHVFYPLLLFSYIHGVSPSKSLQFGRKSVP